MHYPFRPATLARLGLAACCALLPSALRAQADSGMMGSDSGALSHGDGMMMGSDSAMVHDGGMTHEGAMGHDANEPDRMFMGAASHKAAGDYAIEEKDGKRRLTLTSDFAVDDAADAYLVLAAGDAPDRDAVWLGRVESRKAGQSFVIPPRVDLARYRRVLVWSKRSRSLLAGADLAPAGDSMMQH
jgi:hypothetical protein